MAYYRPGYASNGQYYGPGVYYGGYPGYGGYGGSGGVFGGTNDGDGGFGALSQFGGFDLRVARRVRFAHGVLASLAFVVVFPVGAIAIRIIPGRFALFVHAGFQICGYLLYAIGFGMGCWLIREVRFGNFDLVSATFKKSYKAKFLTYLQVNNKHPIIGIVIFLALLFQPVLGALHHIGFKRHGRRTVISHLHLWIGRIMITLGIINGGLGLLLASNSRSGEIIYAVVAAVFWFTWMIAACFGEVRRATKSRHGHREKGSPHVDGGHVRDVNEPVATGARAAPVTTKTADAYA